MDDPFTVEIPVRYRDLDTYNHVNNAVYATYLEEARVAYLDAVLEVGVGSYEFVVAGLELSFERPVTLGDSLIAAVETARLGETSWTQAYELRADGELAATGETTVVFVDSAEMRPKTVPADVRRRVTAFEGLES